MKNYMMFLLLVMFFLCSPCELFGQTLLSALSAVRRVPTTAVCSMNIYPETISIGDTLYVTLKVYNPHEETILFSDSYLGDGRFRGTVRLDIIDSSQRTFPLLCEIPMRRVLNWAPQNLILKPAETRVICKYSVTIPPLEDLFGNPYWQKILDVLPEKGARFILKVTLADSYSRDTSQELRRGKEENKRFLEKEFLLQQRPKKEIELFRQWYKNTPKNLLPEIDTEIAPLPVKIGGAYSTELRNKLPKEHNSIFRYGNRYPGYPNFPSDWRGWKKLEESFEASTLRDEIRWTRICLQYCTTADEKVLEELKVWLGKMNPIQRTVMVNYFRKNENLPNSEKLYNTIQQFKIAPKKD
ncbi:MAG: hypothetical protein LBC74_06495 [Planctomycetaceae bacterium]|jgi:hypothetical protein|nr:hypothetical protein [Planctomycetaceae bacterium]